MPLDYQSFPLLSYNIAAHMSHDFIVFAFLNLSCLEQEEMLHRAELGRRDEERRKGEELQQLQELRKLVSRI